MKWQLFYTSARRGLESGSYGFTIVARDKEFPGKLQRYLVRISHFDQRLRTPEGLASFRIFTVNGETYYILSRIRKSGSDYSGRGNFLAQHLVLDKAETFGLPSPAVLLRDWEGWRENWNTPARYLDDNDYPDWPEEKEDIRSAWESATGEAEYASHLAFITSREKPGVLHFKMAESFGQGLALFANSAMILREVAWEKPFTTCLQIKDKPDDFEWITLVPKVSPEKSLVTPAEDSHLFDFTQNPPKLPSCQGKDLRMERQHDGARRLRGDYFRRAPRPGEVRASTRKKKGPVRTFGTPPAPSKSAKQKLILYAAVGVASIIALAAIGFILANLFSPPPPPSAERPATQEQDQSTIPPLSQQEVEPEDVSALPEETLEEAPPAWEAALTELRQTLETAPSPPDPFSLSSATVLQAYRQFIEEEPPAEQIAEIKPLLPWSRQNYFLVVEDIGDLDTTRGVENFPLWQEDLYSLIGQTQKWVVPGLGSWSRVEDSAETVLFAHEDNSNDDFQVYFSDLSEDRELLLPEILIEELENSSSGAIFLELQFAENARPSVGLFLLLKTEEPVMRAPIDHLERINAQEPGLALTHWPIDLLQPSREAAPNASAFRLVSRMENPFTDEVLSQWFEQMLHHGNHLIPEEGSEDIHTLTLLPREEENFPLSPENLSETITPAADIAPGEDLSSLQNEKQTLQTLLAFSQVELSLAGLENRWATLPGGEGWHGERTTQQMEIVGQHYDNIKEVILTNSGKWNSPNPDLANLVADLPERPPHSGLQNEHWKNEVFAHFILLSAWKLEQDLDSLFVELVENEETAPPEEISSEEGLDEYEEEPAESEQDIGNIEEAPPITLAGLMLAQGEDFARYHEALSNARTEWQNDLREQLKEIEQLIQEKRLSHFTAFIQSQQQQSLPFAPWTLYFGEQPLILFE